MHVSLTLRSVVDPDSPAEDRSVVAMGGILRSFWQLITSRSLRNNEMNLEEF
jgi:hypothetical protein